MSSSSRQPFPDDNLPDLATMAIGTLRRAQGREAQLAAREQLQGLATELEHAMARLEARMRGPRQYLDQARCVLDPQEWSAQWRDFEQRYVRRHAELGETLDRVTGALRGW